MISVSIDMFEAFSNPSWSLTAPRVKKKGSEFVGISLMFQYPLNLLLMTCITLGRASSLSFGSGKGSSSPCIFSADVVC